MANFPELRYHCPYVHYNDALVKKHANSILGSYWQRTCCSINGALIDYDLSLSGRVIPDELTPLSVMALLVCPGLVQDLSFGNHNVHSLLHPHNVQHKVSGLWYRNLRPAMGVCLPLYSSAL